MKFKKTKAVTLVELLIYIALSIIVSLILLQATNLILNKKNINDEIKENVESIEARKASALLSQYIKKPITAIPPFDNLPPSPPRSIILPGSSVPIFNPWENISPSGEFINDYENNKDCYCETCTIAYFQPGPHSTEVITFAEQEKNIKSIFIDSCHAKHYFIGGGRPAIAWTDCPPEYFEEDNILNPYTTRTDEIMQGLTVTESPQEAIDYLEQEKILRECYERKIRENKDVAECDFMDAIKEKIEKKNDKTFTEEECPKCIFAKVIWIPWEGGDEDIYSRSPNSIIDTYNRFAWSSNVGWIDFSEITTGNKSLDLGGYATVVNNNSKISLNCENTNSCKNSDYKVSVSEKGVLHGHAWGGDSLGWISFSCKEGGQNGEDICDTSLYGVYIESQTAKLNGYAWSENIGWISFDCSTGGTDMSSVCSTSDYGVQLSYLKQGSITVGFEEGSYTIPLEGYNQYDIDSVSNTTATNDGVFTLTSISGSNFMTGALVYLYNKDYGNVYSINTPTYNSNEMISNIQFDLENKPTGYYSAVFVNPNGDYGILNNAINVTSN